MYASHAARETHWHLAGIAAALILLAGVPGSAPILAGCALALAARSADRGAEAETIGLAALAAGLCWPAVAAFAVAIGWAAARRVAVSEAAIWTAAGLAAATVAGQLAAARAIEPSGLFAALPAIGLGWATALPAVLATGVAAFLAARISIAPAVPGQFGLALAAACALAVATLPGVESRAAALVIFPALAVALAAGRGQQRLTALLVQSVATTAAIASANAGPVLEAIAHAALLVTGCVAVRAAVANAVNDNPFLARGLRANRLLIAPRHC